MLGIYLFCAILGGGLLVFSLLGGADHDMDHDASGVGGDHDLSHDFDHDTGHGGHDVQHGGSAAGILFGLFRPRNLIFLLAGFGLTGTLLMLLTGASGAGSLVPAAVMGLVAMVGTHGVFTWLRASDSATDAISDHDLEGASGRVVLPVSEESRGRIVCQIAGREVSLVAKLTPTESQPLVVGSEVIVLRVQDSVAEVMPFKSKEIPPSTE